MRMKRALAGAVLVGLSWSAPSQAQEGDASQEFTRAVAAMSRGEYDEAVRRFQAVVKTDPKSFEAHNNLAVIYVEQGKYDAALVEMKEVIRLEPSYLRGRKNLAELYARLAHNAYVDAAAVAPPEQQEQLTTRARQIGPPPPRGAVVGAALEAAAGTPTKPTAAVVEAKAKNEPAAPPAAAPVAAVPAAVVEGTPVEFLALADVPGIAMSDAGMRLFRQIGASVQPAERMPVKKAAPLPAKPTFYVAVPGDGRIDLVPLDRGEKPVSVRDSGGTARDVVVDPQALTAMRDAVQAYMTPAVLGGTLHTGDATAGQAKRAAVLAAFQSWARAWQGKNIEEYIASYADDYNPKGGPGHDKWRDQRAKVFERSGEIAVQLSEPVMLQDGDEVVTLSRQEYRSKLQSSSGVKKLTWVSTPQGWKISAEEMLSEKKV